MNARKDRTNVTGESGSGSTVLGDALLQAMRQAVREEIRIVLRDGREKKELLTPEELSKHLKVPISWVYEQSRLGKIPTRRIGRYIRFDLDEVLASQKDIAE